MVIVEVYFVMSFIFVLCVFTGCSIIDGIVEVKFRLFYSKSGVALSILSKRVMRGWWGELKRLGGFQRSEFFHCVVG